MRIILIFTCSFCLFSCMPIQKNVIIAPVDKANSKSIDSASNFQILEIDSSGNIYVISGKKNDSVYKIVSMKDSIQCENKIRVGLYYSFTLKSVFPDGYFQKDRISVVRYGAIKVPLGGSKDVVVDLFSTNNLTGLCLN